MFICNRGPKKGIQILHSLLCIHQGAIMLPSYSSIMSQQVLLNERYCCNRKAAEITCTAREATHTTAEMNKESDDI
jgi:hypothetical protein